MKTICLAVAVLVIAALSPVARGTGLIITGSFDSTITSLPDASAVEAGINAAISVFEADVTTPITVNIVFTGTNTGLGQSDTLFDAIPYTQYLSDLNNNPTQSAYDKIALAHLPATDPLKTNGGVTLSTPLLRAIGESTLGDTGGEEDGTISLNLSDMNISRTGTIDPDKYDLEAVAMHEIDEVLGAGGAGSQLPDTTGTTVGPLDLYRFTAPGVRSFTTGTSIAPYFSIDGGTTQLVYFNQAGGGSDYSDWGDGQIPPDDEGNTPPQIQDAFGTPGITDETLGTNELIALDVIGYNVAMVPEPETCAVLGLGAVTLLVLRRRRRRVILPRRD